MAGPTSVAEYVATVPEDLRPRLEELRRVILGVLPDAIEAISYQMPAVRFEGRIVVWYAAFRKHYSVFPASARVVEELGDELGPYLAGKGTIRFPAGRPLPVDLIERVVRVRVEENRARA
jgi:uncharacterized protein YdhG (YjbR/CyaY superfamily)